MYVPLQIAVVLMSMFVGSSFLSTESPSSSRNDSAESVTCQALTKASRKLSNGLRAESSDVYVHVYSCFLAMRRKSS